jgi:hypothetical protein
VVLGNHDLHLVMQSEGYGKASKEDTFGDVLAAADRDELLSWLRAQPLVHVEGDWAMVHAGLLPGWTVAQAQAAFRRGVRRLDGRWNYPRVPCATCGARSRPSGATTCRAGIACAWW